MIGIGITLIVLGVLGICIVQPRDDSLPGALVIIGVLMVAGNLSWIGLKAFYHSPTCMEWFWWWVTLGR